MERIEVLKTYKIYIGGSFPRTESGRYYALVDKNGKTCANVCLSSRKDVRNAVVAARKAVGPWSEKSAFNRSQILYRIAEMVEGRRDQFLNELVIQGNTKANASKEVDEAIDRLIYYAGWCDKYQQVLGSVNPVASSHFNFSTHEPVGVVGILPDSNSGLIGLVSLMAPVIAGGNTCVLIAAEDWPLCAITFAEVLHSSDVSAGVVNILTGKQNELIGPLATHMDVNAIAYSGADSTVITRLRLDALDNLKRVRIYTKNWKEKAAQDLYMIADFQEVKTTWHPIEDIGGASSSY